MPAIATQQYELIFHDPEYSLWLTFISFSLVAAAGYIFNDLADFEADRKHPIKKKYKPIATGAIDKQVASFWLAVFLIGGLTISRKLLNNHVILWELAYFATGVVYSLFLKRTKYFGLFFVSLGAIFRVLAGAAALEISALPTWLMIAAILNLIINFAIQAKQNKRLKS